MQKVKEFILNYKKTLFIVLIILLMAIIVGGMMLSKPKSQSTEKKENVTEETNKIDEAENTNNNPATSESKQQEKEEVEKQEQDKKSNSSTKSSTTKSSSQTDAKKSASQSTSTNTNKMQSSQSTTPSHQHVWKEHTAKRWVSKMVTVPDYENQKVTVGTNFIFAEDGYVTNDINDAKAHAKELIKAGYIGNYRTEAIYEEKQVQVGSHQEDQGYYETYVDYYYCDCGARKEA